MNNAQKDKAYIWHPFTQTEGLNLLPVITHGKGALLFDENGKEYIDAISSWWVNIHGHANPYIAKKIAKQAKKLEQLIFAGFTHTPAIELSERLIQKLPTDFSKIFFSDNGSTSIEVAIKMAIQYWHNKGLPKTKIIALTNAYHGDTFGAMAVGERGLFNRPFESLFFDVEFIDPTKPDEAKLKFAALAKTNQIAAFIYEPLIQGSGGMIFYEHQLLNELIDISNYHSIICIADEVMTGFYRTGKFLASNYLNYSPDIICLSKGLTGGFLPMGITACKGYIFDAFTSTDKFKTFFHGHSYTANPLSCTAALASLDLIEMPNFETRIRKIEQAHLKFLNQLKKIPKVENPRVLGTILSFEVKNEQNTSYFNNIRYLLYNKFIENGVLLRPLGNTVYIMPPYIITQKQLQKVYDTIDLVLKEV
jgi:adenosylmethionine-8-amino-7-oxononanoate aminotransferase